LIHFYKRDPACSHQLTKQEVGKLMLMGGG